MCRLSRGQDQIDTPQVSQVSPQVAKKPSIKDTIWIKLGDVSHFTNLENLMKVPGLHGLEYSKYLYAYRISANEFLHEQVPGIVQGTPCLALPGEPGRLDCAVDSVDQSCVLVCQFLVFCYCLVPNCQV